MPDDKTKVGEPDRSRVSGDQDCEVRYFAEKHGISIEGAIDLINRFGNNREKLEEAANKLRASAEPSGYGLSVEVAIIDGIAALALAGFLLAGCARSRFAS